MVILPVTSLVPRLMEDTEELTVWHFALVVRQSPFLRLLFSQYFLCIACKLLNEIVWSVSVLNLGKNVSLDAVTSV